MRNSRPMPQWVVQEPNGRVGPKPPAPPIPGHQQGPPLIPPKKAQPDPDYEVIDFSAQQQYTNAQPLKLPPPGSKPPQKCELCGSLQPKYRCEQCKNQILCASCDDMYHRHPKRKGHVRKVVELHTATNVRPPLPPKGDHAVPVPPPRRKQKHSFACPQTPTMPHGTTGRMETPPSPSLSLRERMSTLKRMIVPGGNRTGNGDEPPAPRTAAPPPLPSRPTTTRPITPLGGNPFDAIQKPPSIAMEKIKQQQSATLDRMSMLQQRYRQSQLNLHAASTSAAAGDRQPAMMSGTEPKRRVSSASQVDLRSMPQNGRRSSYTTNTDFASASSDQWSNHSGTMGPRMRAGSMATGMNTHANRLSGSVDPRFATLQSARRSPGIASDNERPRTAMSHSVFDLQPQQQQQQQQQHPMMAGNANGFGGGNAMFGQTAGGGMHQHTQPTGNCMSCSQQQLNWSNAAAPPSPGAAYPGGAWDMNAHHLNGSNMSLNLLPSTYYPQRQGAMQRPDIPPPAAWFNGGWAAAPMYPYPMGMMPVHPADYHDRRSRGPSRSQSRAASPTMSLKSRKSTLSSARLPAHRAHSFVGGHRPTVNHRSLGHDDDDGDLVDSFSEDEDYVDDFRSFSGNGTRRNSSISATVMRRRNSRHQQSTDQSDDANSAAEMAAAAAATAKLNRRLSYRERRSGSATRTVKAPAATKVSTGTTTVAAAVPSASTLLSADSGSESGTRALVQAKIMQKVQAVQQSSVDESSSDFWRQPAVAPVAKPVAAPPQTKPAPAKPAPAKPAPVASVPAAPVAKTVATRKVAAVEPVEPEILRLIDAAEQAKPVSPPPAPDADAIVAAAEDIDDSGPVGPPPTTPDFEWECEFCTFVNEPHTKICIVCCKTPVTAPARKTSVAGVGGAGNTLSTAGPALDKETSPASSERAKGKPRKISFWPGTKAK